jgi:uncharacterized protein YdeI (YjbR/CyaY-like superfamily)
MPMPSKSVDGFLRKSSEWREELTALREIVLASELTEDVKWRTPCYTWEDKNVALLGRMNECCSISFMKGALMKDPASVLEMPGENTQSARVIRITSVDEVKKLKTAIESFIAQGIAIEKAGVKYEFKKIDAFPLPEELEAMFAEAPELKTAWKALTPGRQRGWLLHFNGAKQSKTRVSRIEKAMEAIFAGKGMHD